VKNALVLYIEDENEATMIRDIIVEILDSLKASDIPTGAFELIACNQAESPGAMLAANGVRTEIRKLTEVEYRYRQDDDDDVIRELPEPIPLH
jgi:hypothetical protein